MISLLVQNSVATNSLGLWWKEASQIPIGEFSEPLIVPSIADGVAIRAELERVRERHWMVSIEEILPDQTKSAAQLPSVFLDQLTGYANRCLFERRLDAALIQVAAGSLTNTKIFFLDLDRFKAVNDTLGHAAGDALLKLVCQRLKSGLREEDLLARFGGDEFAILLSEKNDCLPTDLANRLVDLVKRPYLINGHLVNIGASIGIAIAPQDGSTVDRVLRSADLALYSAKAAGRGRVHCFASSMEDRAQQRRQLEIDLRKAIPLRQLGLHYQPQIDVETGSVIGVEALLRWQRPNHGTLLPSEFLGVAEEIGLAASIGEWVIKTACKDARDWPEPITVGVNVFARHFEMEDFAEGVERALQTSGLEGRRLEIEVTEELLLREADTIQATINALRAMGVRMAMGGFGTGLASLSQLVSVPFDKIKIDRTLIQGVHQDTRSRAILRAVSAFGKSLGIATLAEGVETREHLCHVRDEGCQSVQGFFYSNPVPVKSLAQYFSEAAQNNFRGLKEETE